MNILLKASKTDIPYACARKEDNFVWKLTSEANYYFPTEEQLNIT
jgi:hypothetical protein